MSKLSTPRHNLLKKKCVDYVLFHLPAVFLKLKDEVEKELHQRRKPTMSPSNKRTNFIRQECVRWMKTHAIHNFHKIQQAAGKKFPTDPKHGRRGFNLRKGDTPCTNLKAASRVHISIDQP